MQEDKQRERVVVVVICVHRELGLARPVLASPMVPSKAFKVVFVHLVYNSALFLSSCCSSVLLRVLPNLFCLSS